MPQLSRFARVLSASALLATLGQLARPLPEAQARPGGGSSFRSSSSGSRSSGSSGSSFRSSSSSSSSRSSGSSSSSSSRGSSSSSSSWGSGSAGLPYSGGGSSSAPSSSSDSGSDAENEGVYEAIAGGILTLPGILGMWAVRPIVLKRGPRGWRSVWRWLLGLPLCLFSLAMLLVMSWPGRLVAGAILGLAALLLFVDDTAPNKVQASGGGLDPQELARRRAALGALRARDPGFSRVTFLDFVQALYTGVHAAAGTPRASHLRPFLAPPAFEALEKRLAPATYSEVVLGTLTLDHLGLGEGVDRISVLLEANVTRQLPGAEPSRQVTRERWTFERVLGAQSPEPSRMRVLSCTNCGAPADFSDAGACRFCGQVFEPGKHQWRLVESTQLALESFGTEGLGETVPEQGTDHATVFHPELGAQRKALVDAHGLPDFEAFEVPFHRDTVGPVFRQMYAAWSQRSWGDVRHLLGDRLWESQRLWVKAYEAKGYTNRLDDLRLEGIETVRVERDAHFEAVTVRLRAACRDYTVNDKGKVVGGSSKELRRFSEYWTFLRSTHAQPRSGSYESRTCPSCGAGLDRMGEAAECGYCSAKVSTGDFGWVLTLIVQDEVYELDA